MAIRGWVYVLSNRAMPGLVKIGYSTKDPILRAAELDGTGIPHPFIVAYDVLVLEPREVEQETHGVLSSFRESKEFFKVEVAVAVQAIKHVVLRQRKEILLQQGEDPSSEGWTPTSKVSCPYCKTMTYASDTTFVCKGCGRVFRSDMCISK